MRTDRGKKKRSWGSKKERNIPYSAPPSAVSAPDKREREQLDARRVDARRLRRGFIFTHRAHLVTEAVLREQNGEADNERQVEEREVKLHGAVEEV